MSTVCFHGKHHLSLNYFCVHRTAFYIFIFHRYYLQSTFYISSQGLIHRGEIPPPPKPSKTSVPSTKKSKFGVDKIAKIDRSKVFLKFQYTMVCTLEKNPRPKSPFGSALVFPVQYEYILLHVDMGFCTS